MSYITAGMLLFVQITYAAWSLDVDGHPRGKREHDEESWTDRAAAFTPGKEKDTCFIAMPENIKNPIVFYFTG